MDGLLQDLRFGIRQLVRQRGVALVALLTLALGIGASTAIFSIVDAAMLRPLPYPDPEQLVTLGVAIERPGSENPSRPTPSYDDFRLWRTAGDVFSVVAGHGSMFSGRITDGPEPERVRVATMTEGYLGMYGVVPAIGRDFNPDDMVPGAPAVVIISYGYWQRRFGGDPDVLGQTLRYNDGVATIVGVLPASFSEQEPIWQPLQPRQGMESRRGMGSWLGVYARLRPGVSLAQAEERLSAMMEGVPGPDGQTLEVRARLTSRLDSAVNRYETTVNILAGAVGLVLLIACVNVAGLLLVRGASREGELAVRASLGARRGRLIRQLLTESVVLSLAGGLVGMGVAWLSLDVLVANIPLSLPSAEAVTLNLPVLGAALALTIATGLLFGLLPALRLSRVSLSSTLARSSRRQGAALSRRGGQLLIAAEVALAVVLVAGAGLMLRSFSRLAAVDMGYDPSGLVVMEVLPFDPDAAVHAEYFPALLRQVRAMPDVQAAGAVDWFALGGGASYSSVRVDGERKGVGPREIMPGYFEALGLPVVDGRLMTPEEYEGGVNGALINETAARELFPDGRAVDRQFTTYDDTTYTVLGVVGDLLHGGPTGDASAEVYLPFRPSDSGLGRSLTVVVRPSASSPGFAARLRQTAQSIGPRVLIESIRAGSDWWGDRVVTPRRRTMMLSLLGGLGLLLALVGVFGMTAFAVACRTQEIGLRMTFGARPGQVVGTMVRDAAWPILLGTGVGIGGALLATGAIESYLFETAPTDPGTFAAVATVLVVTGCLAAWIPARRAARVDPVQALRAE